MSASESETRGALAEKDETYTEHVVKQVLDRVWYLERSNLIYARRREGMEPTGGIIARVQPHIVTHRVPYMPHGSLFE